MSTHTILLMCFLIGSVGISCGFIALLTFFENGYTKFVGFLSIVFYVCIIFAFVFIANRIFVDKVLVGITIHSPLDIRWDEQLKTYQVYQRFETGWTTQGFETRFKIPYNDSLVYFFVTEEYVRGIYRTEESHLKQMRYKDLLTLIRQLENEKLTANR